MTKTVNSFAALGEMWNAAHGKKEQVRLVTNCTEKARKCRICGGEMVRLPNTNVWMCQGMIEVPKPTEDNPAATELKRCTNYALSKR